jgi:hypothetical protein
LSGRDLSQRRTKLQLKIRKRSRIGERDGGRGIDEELGRN